MVAREAGSHLQKFGKKKWAQGPFRSSAVVSHPNIGTPRVLRWLNRETDRRSVPGAAKAVPDEIPHQPSRG
jgi:hypothetical protein